MAITPTIRSSQGFLATAVEPTTTVEASQASVNTIVDASNPVQVAQLSFAVAYNIPTDFIEASQLDTAIAVNASPAIQVSQLSMMVGVLPRTQFRRSRVWAYTLDSHDILVLRVGENETLICDLSTEQWAQWSSKDRNNWRAHLGINWLGIDSENWKAGARTNVVAGDDTYGILWTLDPSEGTDDSPTDPAIQLEYPRIVTAGVPMRMRTSVSHDALYLTIRNNDVSNSLSSIQLEMSDDNGKTFRDMGTVQVTAGNDQEVAWRALGLIRAPGRLFRITDYGATSVLYSLDARIGNEDT